jgi:hypothetical protein
MSNCQQPLVLREVIVAVISVVHVAVYTAMLHKAARTEMCIE